MSALYLRMAGYTFQCTHLTTLLVGRNTKPFEAAYRLPPNNPAL